MSSRKSPTKTSQVPSGSGSPRVKGRRPGADPAAKSATATTTKPSAITASGVTGTPAAPASESRGKDQRAAVVPATASEARGNEVAKGEAKEQDVVVLGGPTEDGRGVNVLRAKKDSLQIGTVRPLEHGKPIAGEVVRLTPRPGQSRICDVETELDVVPASKGRPTTAGPAQVATDKYRKNWDQIWARPAAKKQLLN